MTSEEKVAKLFDQYYSYLVMRAYQILNSYSMAEDVVQEAFTRLVINNNLDKIENVNSRRTRNFLLKIVIRLAFTKYRQSNKINCVEFHEEFYRTQTESSLDPTWEQYELIDKKEFLNSQISKLPERDQELLIST